MLPTASNITQGSLLVSIATDCYLYQEGRGRRAGTAVSLQQQHLQLLAESPWEEKPPNSRRGPRHVTPAAPCKAVAVAWPQQPSEHREDARVLLPQQAALRLSNTPYFETSPADSERAAAEGMGEHH